MELPEIKIRKILVPTDGSEYSIKAAKFASDLAQLKKARIVALHVSAIYLQPEFQSGVPYVDFPILTKEEEKFAQMCTQSVAKLAIDSGLEVEERIIGTGTSVVHTICEFARREGCDLIVVGAKGRSGIKKLLMGSVSMGVVTNAPCPVLVVR
ncbi:MAG: universal stress protein [Candidatus Methylarchaceae archaeon HK02M1]|nr:universal stress protein [Candidatus Methylarchaceae archaeon HK02M1]